MLRRGPYPYPLQSSCRFIVLIRRQLLPYLQYSVYSGYFTCRTEAYRARDERTAEPGPCLIIASESGLWMMHYYCQPLIDEPAVYHAHLSLLAELDIKLCTRNQREILPQRLRVEIYYIGH